MTAELHNARLEFEGPANILQRALGRGGAPVDLEAARAALPAVLTSLQNNNKLLDIATWPRFTGKNEDYAFITEAMQQAIERGYGADLRQFIEEIELWAHLVNVPDAERFTAAANEILWRAGPRRATVEVPS
jgi:hypothetical protein